MIKTRLSPEMSNCILKSALSCRMHAYAYNMGQVNVVILCFSKIVRLLFC